MDQVINLQKATPMHECQVSPPGGKVSYINTCEFLKLNSNCWFLAGWQVYIILKLIEISSYILVWIRWSVLKVRESFKYFIFLDRFC